MAFYRGGHTTERIYVGTHDTSFGDEPGGPPTAHTASGMARYDAEGRFDPTWFPAFAESDQSAPWDGGFLKVWPILPFEEVDWLVVGGDFGRVRETDGSPVSPAPLRLAIYREPRAE